MARLHCGFSVWAIPTVTNHLLASQVWCATISKRSNGEIALDKSRQGSNSQTDVPAGGRSLLWRVLPPLLLVLAGLAFVFVPMATSCVDTSDGVETCTNTTLLSNEESWIPLMSLLGLPLVLSLIAALTNRRWAAIASAAAVSFFMLLSLASVGIFLIPAVLAAWILALRPIRRSAV